MKVVNIKIGFDWIGSAKKLWSGAVEDSKRAFRAAASPRYWLIFFVKKPLFSCKRHIFRCTHLQ